MLTGSVSLILQALLALALGQRQQRCVVDGVDMCRYESHKEMINKLMSLQQQYPRIVKVGRIKCNDSQLKSHGYPGWLYWEVSVWATSGIRQAEPRCWSEK